LVDKKRSSTRSINFDSVRIANVPDKYLLLVEFGASMMVASISVPSFTSTPASLSQALTSSKSDEPSHADQANGGSS
tara:strand:- start:12106 stop:12336 length:231 start_codon:yes stop_codon:yes gene_type:complete